MMHATPNSQENAIYQIAIFCSRLLTAVREFSTPFETFYCDLQRCTIKIVDHFLEHQIADLQPQKRNKRKLRTE